EHGEPGQPVRALRAGLLAARAEAAATHGAPAAAVADLQEALALTPPGPERAHRLSRLAMLTFGARDPLRAAELAELAVVEAGADAAARAVALETAAILDMNLHRPDRARDRADAALALFRAAGDGGGVARILDGRAMATFLDGRIAEGTEVLGRVAQLFGDSGELLRTVTPRSTRGHGLVFLGRPADGLAETDAALRLARDLDAPEAQAYALWHRSEALSGLDRTDEAEAAAREALSIARDVGHRGRAGRGGPRAARRGGGGRGPRAVGRAAAGALRGAARRGRGARRARGPGARRSRGGRAGPRGVRWASRLGGAAGTARAWRVGF
ncbi:MAG: hypothetical protein NTW05_04645, partial [Pseudonocardiales bacterium]|nr:hypothetical protein [Pseudonocardiales bacterium]